MRHILNIYTILLKNSRFDKLGIFEYSKEKNTQSFSLKNHIPQKIKTARRKTLMQLQQ